MCTSLVGIYFRSGDGQEAHGRALPRRHPLVGVLVVLAAEADVALADAQQIDADAHVGS